MDSGDSFPFERLPTDIQFRILTLLSISTLALCKAVSRLWRSLISSPAFTDSYPLHRRDDLIFLLFADSDYHSYGSAYLPSRDRWIRIPLPPIVHPLVTGTSLILAKIVPNHIAILYPFDRHHTQAGVEEDGVIVRICIWKLDRGGKEWKEVSCMPQGYLDLFDSWDNHFEIVDKEGMVCFYEQARDHYIVMCDLAVKRWWLPQPCHVPWDNMMWFGVAIEPHVHLLK